MIINLLLVVLFIIFAIYSFYNSRMTHHQRMYNAALDLLFACGILLSLLNNFLAYVGNTIVFVVFIYSCYQWYKNSRA